MEFDGGGGEADHPRLDFGGGAGHRNLMSVLTMWLSLTPTPYKHYIYIVVFLLHFGRRCSLGHGGFACLLRQVDRYTTTLGHCPMWITLDTTTPLGSTQIAAKTMIILWIERIIVFIVVLVIRHACCCCFHRCRYGSPKSKKKRKNHCCGLDCHFMVRRVLLVVWIVIVIFLLVLLVVVVVLFILVIHLFDC